MYIVLKNRLGGNRLDDNKAVSRLLIFIFAILS